MIREDEAPCTCGVGPSGDLDSHSITCSRGWATPEQARKARACEDAGQALRLAQQALSLALVGDLPLITAPHVLRDDGTEGAGPWVCECSASHADFTKIAHAATCNWAVVATALAAIDEIVGPA